MNQYINRTKEALKQAEQQQQNVTGINPSHVGISSVMGAATGVACHRLTSDALYGAGLLFMSMQCLAYMGFITIQWNAIEQAAVKAVDQNGDGQLDSQDVRIALRKFFTYMKRGLPHASGFSSGFFFGYRYLA